MPMNESLKLIPRRLTRTIIKAGWSNRKHQVTMITNRAY